MDNITRWLIANTALGKDIMDDVDAACHDFVKALKPVEPKVEVKQTKMDGIAEFFACMGMFSKAEEIQLKAGKTKNHTSTCLSMECQRCDKMFFYRLESDGLVTCPHCNTNQLPF